MQSLKNTQIGKTSLLNLATHTSGLPLAAAKKLTNRKAAIAYLRHWQPKYSHDSRYVYSNLGIGLLGYILEHQSKKSYAQLLEERILVPYGLTHTKINAPGKEHLPKDSIYIAADGITSTASDMLKFMHLMLLDNAKSSRMHKSVNMALKSYYKTPYLMQTLSWQKYPWPLSLRKFLKSASLKTLNTQAIKLKANAQDQKNFLVIKTGSWPYTSSIVALLPKQKIGVAILVNKNIRMPARFKLAYKLLKTQLQMAK